MAIVGLLMILLGTVCPVVADQCDRWQSLNLLPTAAHLEDVAWGDTLFVAVGDSGRIIVSPDHVSWQLVQSGTSAGLTGVAFGDGHFVAVGADGSIVVSQDGQHWSTVNSGVMVSLEDVAWGPGGFVAVGEYGITLTSPDGTTWASRWTGIELRLNAVTWSDHGFVTVGEDGNAFWSIDGSFWLPCETGLRGNLVAVTADRDVVLVVSDNELTARTTDLLSWNVKRVFHARFEDLESCHGTLAALTSMGNHLFSFDRGQTWHRQLGSGWLRIRALECGPEGFVGVGRGGLVAVGRGVAWKVVNAATTEPLTEIESNGTKLLALGGGGVAFVGNGTDEWLTSQVRLTDIAWGHGRYVGLGLGWCGDVCCCSAIATSEDGMTWTTVASGFSGKWEAVVFDGRRFVAASASGELAISRDGEQWLRRRTESWSTLNAIASNGELIVGVGTFGQVAVATDDEAWSLNQIEGFDGHFEAVAWGGSTFVAVGPDGTIMSSPDGAEWVLHATGTTARLRSITWTGSRFIAVGDEGTVLESPDGIDWTQQTPKHAINIWDVTWDGRFLIAVGANGLVQRTLCDAPQEVPAPEMTWRPLYPRAGEPIRFFDLTYGEVSARRWDLGDGSTSVGGATTHVYDEAGTFLVQLAVTAADTEVETEATITVSRRCPESPDSALIRPDDCRYR